MVTCQLCLDEKELVVPGIPCPVCQGDKSLSVYQNAALSLYSEITPETIKKAKVILWGALYANSS